MCVYDCVGIHSLMLTISCHYENKNCIYLGDKEAGWSTCRIMGKINQRIALNSHCHSSIDSSIDSILHSIKCRWKISLRSEEDEACLELSALPGLCPGIFFQESVLYVIALLMRCTGSMAITKVESPFVVDFRWMTPSHQCPAAMLFTVVRFRVYVGTLFCSSVPYR